MDYIQSAQSVIEIERDSIAALYSRIDNQFAQACERIKQCQGRLIILGLGKSGHIGSKIAATLASTGTPAFFVNAGEANHGDFGMIVKNDIVLAISNSGNTAEILQLLPLLHTLNVPLIALTGNPKSPLAQKADIHLDVSVEQEACPLGLAPTASTTATLVMGDALAIALLEARGFKTEDFAFSHPGGNLGKQLLLNVENLMTTGDAIPQVNQKRNLHDAILEVSRKRLGMTCVTDKDNHLLGVFTDGDMRRAFESGLALKDTMIDTLMHTTPATVTPSTSAIEALKLMQSKAITSLVVCNDARQVVGVIHIHDCLNAGLH